MSDRCPTCGQRLGAWRPVKVCSKCGRPMRRGDKYRFTEDGRIEHRHCDNPGSYHALGATS